MLNISQEGDRLYTGAIKNKKTTKNMIPLVGGIASSLISGATSLIGGNAARKAEKAAATRAWEREQALMDKQQGHALEQMGVASKLNLDNTIEINERYNTTSAKKRQYEEAGMNPYLAMGLSSGGGGGSMASAGGTSPAGAAMGHAQKENAAAASAVGAQIANAVSQAALNKSLARKAEKEADVIEQTGTSEAEARIANLAASTKNLKVQAELSEVEKGIADIELSIKDATRTNEIRKSEIGFQKLFEEWEYAKAAASREMRRDRMEEEEYDTMRDTMRANLENLIIDLAVKEAQIRGLNVGAWAKGQEVKISWEQLLVNQDQQKTNEWNSKKNAIFEAWGLLLEGQDITTRRDALELERSKAKWDRTVGVITELGKAIAIGLILKGKGAAVGAKGASAEIKNLMRNN